MKTFGNLYTIRALFSPSMTFTSDTERARKENMRQRGRRRKIEMRSINGYIRRCHGTGWACAYGTAHICHRRPKPDRHIYPSPSLSLPHGRVLKLNTIEEISSLSTV